MYYKAIFDFGRPLEAKIPEERAILTKMQLVPLFNDPPTDYAVAAAALTLQDLRLSEAEFGGIEKTSGYPRLGYQPRRGNQANRKKDRRRTQADLL